MYILVSLRVKLQEEINHQGLEILAKYVEGYKILTANIKG